MCPLGNERPRAQLPTMRAWGSRMKGRPRCTSAFTSSTTKHTVIVPKIELVSLQMIAGKEQD